MFELSPVQISLLTVVIMVATQIVKFYRARGGAPLSKAQLAWGTFLVSAVLGVVFALPSLSLALPPFGDDPVAFFMSLALVFQDLVAFVSQLFGVIFVVYEYIGKQFFENIGLTA